MFLRADTRDASRHSRRIEPLEFSSNAFVAPADGQE